MKIIVSKNDKPIDQVTCNSNATIGRKSDCDISIKDPAVSGHHASIEKVGENFVIKDNGSTNGIYIKGRRIQQQTLKNDDVVTIGEHRLKFLIAPTVAQKEAASANTVLPPTPPPRERLPDAAQKGVLKILSGSKAGTSIALEEGLTTIGEPGVQVAAVSRRPQGHFVIHVDGGKDREKALLVNGEPTGFKSRKLENGDKIMIAGMEMQYSLT